MVDTNLPSNALDICSTRRHVHGIGYITSEYVLFHSNIFDLS